MDMTGIFIERLSKGGEPKRLRGMCENNFIVMGKVLHIFFISHGPIFTEASPRQADAEHMRS
jgi:hypothetical protein